MIAVESQGAVVVPQVEGIECGTRALSVVIVTIANSENVAPSVIQGEYSWPGLFDPFHDHAVIVGVAAMPEQVHILIGVRPVVLERVVRRGSGNAAGTWRSQAIVGDACHRIGFE